MDINDPNLPEPHQALIRAAGDTHETIARLAAAKAALTDVRRDPEYTAKQVSTAAYAMRAVEAVLTEKIDAEVAAHIALMEWQLLGEGGESANETVPERTDQST